MAEKATHDTGLHIGRKLTREHLVLTSYSRMNVRLAAQVSTYTLHYLIYTFMKVLSESVADAFVTLRTLGNMEVDTRATEEFVRVFDKFFDLFNTRSLDEGHFKLKPNLNAYYCTNDKRLQVITICNQ